MTCYYCRQPVSHTIGECPLCQEEARKDELLISALTDLAAANATIAELTVALGVLQTVVSTPSIKRIQPCGCVVCICEDEDRCHGCGATSCRTPECVFRGVTHRIEYDDAPSYIQLRAQLSTALSELAAARADLAQINLLRRERVISE